MRSPPQVPPPLVLDLRYAQGLVDGFPLPSYVRHEQGQLLLSAQAGPVNLGYAVARQTYRDVLVEAQLSLRVGQDDDFYGLFIRQSGPLHMIAFGISPSGQVLLAELAGAFKVLLNAPLDSSMRLVRGCQQPQLLSILACGPSLSFLLNRQLVTTLQVSSRYQEGYLGLFLHHERAGETAELAADWLQVRGLFPAWSESVET